MDHTQKLIAALQRLLDCPDLNLDSLEEETHHAIAQAEAAIIDATPALEVVRAVNNHEPLMNALNDLLSLWNDLSQSNPGFLRKLTLQDYQLLNTAPANALAAIKNATPAKVS